MQQVDLSPEGLHVIADNIELSSGLVLEQLWRMLVDLLGRSIAEQIHQDTPAAVMANGFCPLYDSEIQHSRALQNQIATGDGRTYWEGENANIRFADVGLEPYHSKLVHHT